ncbi:MAG: metallophosphoesterase family protein [Aliihoeflea sp.]
MFRLAHFSDIHLGPLPDVTYRELVSKRITGYINWHRSRRGSYHHSIVEAIVDDMHQAAPHHVALTGDLVNLALDKEIEAARHWLEKLPFGPDRVSVVPGNHDAYVPGALDKACRAWAPWMIGDGEPLGAHRGTFPYLRVRDNIALIGLSSARATAPFVAAGFFEHDQAAKVARVLDETGRQGLFRVVMIHHPPVRGATGAHKRLYGIGRFQRMIAEHGAELVLHGHTHRATTASIDAPRGARKVPVIGVPAGGQSHEEGRTPAQYNLIEIGGRPGDWTVELSRRGTTGPAMAIKTIRHEILHLEGGGVTGE